VNPAVAVFLGAVFLDEPLGIRALLGAALVIAAVFATVRSESSPSPVAEELVPDEQPAR
jgi:drug/metabolite transporter (DMT)-like permease